MKNLKLSILLYFAMVTSRIAIYRRAMKFQSQKNKIKK